jgi:hypothetical protein
MVYLLGICGELWYCTASEGINGLAPEVEGSDDDLEDEKMTKREKSKNDDEHRATINQ